MNFKPNLMIVIMTLILFAAAFLIIPQSEENLWGIKGAFGSKSCPIINSIGKPFAFSADCEVWPSGEIVSVFSLKYVLIDIAIFAIILVAAYFISCLIINRKT